MEAKILPFPTHRVGLKKGDYYGCVTEVNQGYALAVRANIPHRATVNVYAQHKRVPHLIIGDWVKFRFTQQGVIVEERLARPGGLPMPKIDYQNGNFMLRRNDPAFRLYKDRDFIAVCGGHTLMRDQEGRITVDGRPVPLH